MAQALNYTFFNFRYELSLARPTRSPLQQQKLQIFWVKYQDNSFQLATFF